MFKSIRIAATRSPVYVVGVTEGAKALPRGLDLPAAARRAATEGLKEPGFTGAAGDVATAGANVLVVGLGPRDGIDADRLRRAGAGLVRILDRRTTTAVRLLLTAAVPKRDLDPGALGRAFGEGMGLANWRVDFFNGTNTKVPKVQGALTVSTDDDAARRGLEEGLLVAEQVNEARRIAATPPNIANPAWVAREARRLAKKVGLTCTVISAAEAERQGMGGLVNVGRGSTSKPCLIVLEHKPARAKRDVKVALVGKTMTYDSGGYSLKVGGSMKGMKYDGNGGCAVLGAMLAIAARKVPVRVVGLLPAAENMVSGDAYRPDDIITMHNGTTVEVTNTDAEGRLILADALSYACKKVKPTAIVDMATLTGGVVVALGSWCAGLFCNDDDLRDRIEASAGRTGEKVWRLPLWDGHRDFMRAQHADLWNSGPKRDGHPIQGAAFLSFFVDDDVPWAHIDIAGVSAVQSATDLHVVGPTGFGVRLLTDLVESYA